MASMDAGLAAASTRGRVQRKPAIGEMLPALHRCAQHTVLVAHNAAFDTRFLQLKEAATGARFEQPVLDTLLAEVGIHTLGQAREAAQKTYYARITH